jgi:putative MATE family efflux protein
MKNFENRLYEGNVFKKLVLFSLPFLVSNTVQSLYNLADMLIVGNVSGEASMVGVHIGGQVTFILTSAVIGLSMGGTVLISQYMGADNKEGMRRATATMFTVLLAASVFITCVMLVFKNPLLRLIQTPEDSFDEAGRYLTCTVLGTVFIFGYNALAALMRAVGDSKRPFYFVLIACFANIALDILFVAVFGWRAFGAALATVISQALSMLLCIVYMIRNKFMFDFKLSSFRVYRHELGLIVKIGLPGMVQNGVTSLSFLFITALANSMGVSASAAVGAVGKFNSFAILPAVAMGASVSTMSAQSIGAGKLDRAVKSGFYGAAIAMAISVAVFAVTQRFPGEILRLFGGGDDMVEAGTVYLRIFCYDYLIVPVVFCLNGLFIGAGHTLFSLFTSLLSSLLLRVPASLILGGIVEPALVGVGLGAPIASAGALLAVLIFFLSGRWRVNVVKGKTGGRYPKPDSL